MPNYRSPAISQSHLTIWQSETHHCSAHTQSLILIFDHSCPAGGQPWTVIVHHLIFVPISWMLSLNIVAKSHLQISVILETLHSHRCLYSLFFLGEIKSRYWQRDESTTRKWKMMDVLMLPSPITPHHTHPTAMQFNATPWQRCNTIYTNVTAVCCSVFCALCALCSVLCALCSVLCVLCSVCYVLCAVLCVLCAMFCALCALCYKDSHTSAWLKLPCCLHLLTSLHF